MPLMLCFEYKHMKYSQSLKKSSKNDLNLYKYKITHFDITFHLIIFIRLQLYLAMQLLKYITIFTIMLFYSCLSMHLIFFRKN